MRHPQEIFLSKFKVKNASPEKKPFSPALLISFEIRNGSESKGYSISSSLCDIYAFDQLVSSSPIYPQTHGLSSYSRAPEPRAGEVQGSIGQVDVLPNKTLRFEKVLWLTPDILRFVNGEFEKGRPGKRKVNLRINIFLHAMRFEKRDEAIVCESGTVHKFDLQHEIGEIEWIDLLKEWGYRTTLIYVPVGLAEMLRERMKTAGFLKEWEVIDELIKKFKGIKPQQIFLCRKETLKQKYLELINMASKQLLIMCKAIDNLTGEPIIKAKRGKNIDVKIITAPISRLKREKFPEIRRFSEALKSLAYNGAEIKQNDNIHARILIADDKAVIGSTDPDYYGLTLHINASLYTEDPTVVEKARMFFDEIWRKSRQVTIRKTS